MMNNNVGGIDRILRIVIGGGLVAAATTGPVSYTHLTLPTILRV